MASHTPVSRLLTPLLQSFRSLSLTTSTTTSTVSTSPILRQTSLLQNGSRSFSSTAAAQAKKSAKGRSIKDQRIALIRYHMQHPKTPRPLRLSRMRSLRHWTIHRAWMLARRKMLASEELELQRMHQSQHAACEALRLLDPPGTKDVGRLYRIAMEKKGIFGKGGVPIEYARFQTETPGREPWNHGWSR